MSSPVSSRTAETPTCPLASAASFVISGCKGFSGAPENSVLPAVGASPAFLEQPPKDSSKTRKPAVAVLAIIFENESPMARRRKFMKVDRIDGHHHTDVDGQEERGSPQSCVRIRVLL